MKWENTREKGFWNFLFKEALYILMTGLAIAFISPVIDYLWFNNEEWLGFAAYLKTAAITSLLLMITYIIGCCIFWTISERLYKKRKNDESN